jgi:hypothetical protein
MNRAKFDRKRLLDLIVSHRGYRRAIADEFGCHMTTLSAWAKKDRVLGQALKEQDALYATAPRMVALKTRQTEELDARHRLMLKQFRSVYRTLKQISDHLELCQTRCKNAVNLRYAGACRFDDKDAEDCFSGRLHSADARSLAREKIREIETLFGNAIEGGPDNDDGNHRCEEKEK